jgi:hypothetical protein
MTKHVSEMNQPTQEAKTRGMLRMIDSNTCLVKIESDSKKQHTPSRTNISQKETSQKKPIKAKRFTLDQFDRLGVLGRGSFGEVFLVKHKLSGELFSLK